VILSTDSGYYRYMKRSNAAPAEQTKRRQELAVLMQPECMGGQRQRAGIFDDLNGVGSSTTAGTLPENSRRRARGAA